VIIAVASGLLVLLGYFVPGLFGGLRDTLVGWAIIVAAFALLVGVINLFTVHWKKISKNPAKGIFSAVLIISLIGTIILVGISGPTGSLSMWIFNYIQVPIESSLMAILAVVLLYAVARLLRRRTDAFAIIFIVTVLILLLGITPLFLYGEVPLLSDVRYFVTRIIAVAGARGLLLGIALGIIATGLRVLMGVDRPYDG
jgi:hypothetical protein